MVFTRASRRSRGEETPRRRREGDQNNNFRAGRTAATPAARPAFATFGALELSASKASADQVASSPPMGIVGRAGPRWYVISHFRWTKGSARPATTGTIAARLTTSRTPSTAIGGGRAGLSWATARGRERDEGRGQKPRREHAHEQSEDAGARLRDEEALDVERRDGLDVQIHHGEEARRRRHLHERPLAQQTQALEQGRRAAPAPDERADPEHERVLEEGPEPDEEPDPQPVGELALAAGAEVIFFFEELGLDRVGGRRLGHEALELAHGTRIKQELVLVLEDALAEEDRDGDGDGREAARGGARRRGPPLALLGGGRGDGRGDREEDVRAREAPRGRRAVVVVVVRRGRRRRRRVERRRIEQRLVEERVVGRGRGREAPAEAGAAGAGAAEVPLDHGAGRGREAGAGEARAGRQARRVVLGQRCRGRGQREEHRRHCHRRVAAPCLVESTTRHSIEGWSGAPPPLLASQMRSMRPEYGWNLLDILCCTIRTGFSAFFC